VALCEADLLQAITSYYIEHNSGVVDRIDRVLSAAPLIHVFKHIVVELVHDPESDACPEQYVALISCKTLLWQGRLVSRSVVTKDGCDTICFEMESMRKCGTVW
jgi:hypothetical protein